MPARIAPVTAADAPAGSQPLLAEVKKHLGHVPNLFATFGHSPAALSGYLSFANALSKGALTAREVELLNLHVSELNGCGYCLSAHHAVSKGLHMSDREVADARLGIGQSARDQALLALARRLVRTGGAFAGGELAQAREAGLDDAALIEVVAHVASKTFSNGVALLAQTEIDIPKAPRLPQP